MKFANFSEDERRQILEARRVADKIFLHAVEPELRRAAGRSVGRRENGGHNRPFALTHPAVRPIIVQKR